MTRRSHVVPLSMAVLFLVGACGEKAAPPAAAPPEVLVAEPVQRDVPVMMELVGQVAGSQDVEIRARVEGYLQQVAFAEGTLVTKGQVLYRIDPKPLQVAVENAKANLATAQTQLDKAANDVKRFEPLVERQAVSRMELDNAVSARKAAAAQVDAARAAVEQAQLNLGYATITAPTNGLVGTTKVKEGNLVGRGESTLLATISVIDPILFRAGITEAEYLRWVRQFKEQQASGEKTTRTPVELFLADGNPHPEKGYLDAVERNVDSTTGTLALQIKFSNPEKVVRPGQYGRIRFQSDERKNALLVPQRAVQELQNLFMLAVVGADNRVSYRSVKVGPRDGGLWVIDEGLKPGERVVVEGAMKVRDGMVVIPKPVPAGGAASSGAPGQGGR